MTAESPQSRPRRLPRRRWIAAGLVVLTALGLVLLYALWWTKPTTFSGVGNRFGFEQTSDAMHAVTVDMVQGSVDAGTETVTLNHVRARVVTNTADALIAFAVCQRKGMPFMSANGTASRSCETVTEVEGAQVRLTPEATTTITMTVAPQRPGRVVIRGMEVDYVRGSDHLWQRGSQATGPVVTMRVSR